MENEHATPMPNALLQELLSRPQLLETLGRVMGSLPTDGAPPAAGQAPPSSDGPGALLASPALKERLPQMMALLSPLLSAAGNAAPPLATHAEGGAAPLPLTPPPLPPSPHGKDPAHGKDPTHAREALLAALKPFLSPERQHTVDMLLQLSRLSDVLRQLH